MVISWDTGMQWILFSRGISSNGYVLALIPEEEIKKIVDQFHDFLRLCIATIINNCDFFVLNMFGVKVSACGMLGLGDDIYFPPSSHQLIQDPSKFPTS